MIESAVEYAINRIEKENLQNESLIRFYEFMKTSPYQGYHNNLQMFCDLYGIYPHCRFIEDDNGKIIGYLPLIKYYHGNKLNEPIGEESIGVAGGYGIDLNESMYSVIKESFYKIINIKLTN